jgi:hypothetical protein
MNTAPDAASSLACRQALQPQIEAWRKTLPARP